MNRKSTPEISIIMATYNRLRYIEESLNSIVNQSYKNWECLIIDDGNNDATKKVLYELSKKDRRFRYFSRPDNYAKGLSGARNFGLDKAKGKYYIFFDDDDIVHPQNLEISLNELIESGGDFCRYEKTPFFGDSGISFRSVTGDFSRMNFSLERLDEMVTGKIPFASCTVLWSYKCFDSIRFNEDLHYAEEWECYTRILLEGFKGVSINKVLYYNRKHKASNTGEFQSKHPKRRKSKILATNLVLDHLAERNKITENINKFFIRLGFELKDFSIINKTLKLSKSSGIQKLQYLLVFKAYPLMKPILRLKGSILKLKFFQNV